MLVILARAKAKDGVSTVTVNNHDNSNINVRLWGSREKVNVLDTGTRFHNVNPAQSIL